MTWIPATLFADFTCPFSYVTEAALRGPTIEGIDLRFRAWELFPAPTTPEPVALPDEDWATLERLAAFHALPLVRPGERFRTRKAHEASAFAAVAGREAEMRDAIYAAYWRDGADIGRIDILGRLAGEVGLDGEEMRIALDIDRFADAVEHDEDVARRLRIPGTPTLFIGSGQQARVLTGAHSPAVLRTLIDEVIQQQSERQTDV